MSGFVLKAATAAASLAIALLASPALADDQPGGAYVGVFAGYGGTTADVATNTVFSPTGYFASTSVPAIGAASAYPVKPQAFLGGIEAGYDIHSGHVMLGIAADIATFNNSKTVTGSNTYPCCSPTAFSIAQTVKSKDLFTIRAKLGMLLDGGSSVYLTGGWAGSDYDYAATFSDTFATASESASASKFRSGWALGAGADLRVGHNLSIAPEYIHTDMGTWTIPGGTLTAFTPAISFPTNTFTHTVRLKSDVLRVGLRYHF